MINKIVGQEIKKLIRNKSSYDGEHQVSDRLKNKMAMDRACKILPGYSCPVILGY